MKKNIITAVIALFCFTVMAQNKQVAVFEPVGDVDTSVREIVRELISSTIVNTDGYTVLGQQLINRTLEEHQLQAGGLIDDAQIVEMGRLMGANLVFVTVIRPLGDNFFISGRLINVQTAQIEQQSTTSTQGGMSDLVSVVQELANGMIDATLSHMAIMYGEPAVFHIYRPRTGLHTVRYDILIDGVVVGRTQNNWRTSIPIYTFGTKTLSASIDGRVAELEINVVPGGVYFIRLGVNTIREETGGTTTRTTASRDTGMNRAGGHSTRGATTSRTTQNTRTINIPTINLVINSIGEREFDAIRDR